MLRHHQSVPTHWGVLAPQPSYSQNNLQNENLVPNAIFQKGPVGKKSKSSSRSYQEEVRSVAEDEFSSSDEHDDQDEYDAWQVSQSQSSRSTLKHSRHS
jgi:hypothetical protein